MGVNDDTTSVLTAGFELGVLGWNTAGTLERLLGGDGDVKLTGLHRAPGGVWLWLNSTVRLFFAGSSPGHPPIGALLVGVQVAGSSVTLRFKRRRKISTWTGDALRSGPAQQL
jgi:hypothetical protein